jgi:hypothetical protein
VINQICTCKWSVNVLYNGVPTCSKGAILWKLCETERNGMRSGGNNLHINDGDGVYRIRVTVRANVILRGDSNNKPNISDPVCGRGYSAVSMGGV